MSSLNVGINFFMGNLKHTQSRKKGMMNPYGTINHLQPLPNPEHSPVVYAPTEFTFVPANFKANPRHCIILSINSSVQIFERALIKGITVIP